MSFNTIIMGSDHIDKEFLLQMLDVFEVFFVLLFLDEPVLLLVTRAIH